MALRYGSEQSENHGNLQKGFDFKNVLILFCIDSGWIQIEGQSESSGGGEIYQHSVARLVVGIQARVAGCV